VRFVNAIPRVNSDRGPSMPAARKMQSDGPHAIIWTRADEVNHGLLHFTGHPDQAGGQPSGPGHRGELV
jgi:hypothetical protein